MNATTRSKHNRELGRFGEQLAQQHLIKSGYKILETNYHVGHKEIDIIAQDADLLVCVEVKTRSKGALVSGAWAIDRKKIGNVTTAGFAYANQHFGNVPVRFDSIICEENDRGVFELTHYKDAFFALAKVY